MKQEILIKPGQDQESWAKLHGRLNWSFSFTKQLKARWIRAEPAPVMLITPDYDTEYRICKQQKKNGRENFKTKIHEYSFSLMKSIQLAIRYPPDTLHFLGWEKFVFDLLS